MLVVSSPAHRRHAPTTEIENERLVTPYERPARADAIADVLANDVTFVMAEPAEHGLEPVFAVHDRDYVLFLEHAWAEWAAEHRSSRQAVPDSFPNVALRHGMGPGRRPSGGVARLSYYAVDAATAIVEGTYAAARGAADVALTAADAVLGGDRVAYGLCRPPGHHAPRAAFAGYCYLNNAAIAAQHATAVGADRVAVVDVDFHHGNGTQQIFYDRGDVFYGSVHGDPNRAYPYFTGFSDETGTGRGARTTMNVSLPTGCDDAGYLAALCQVLEAATAFDPALIVVSLGVDAYRDDPLSDLDVSADAFHSAGAAVAGLARPMVVVQEGGYALDAMGRLVASFLHGAAREPASPALPQPGNNERR
jgi:acetoin utilization deacetylase AcuC-like enzyme